MLANEEYSTQIVLYNSTKHPLVVELQPIISRVFFIGFFPDKLRLPAPRLLKVWCCVVLLISCVYVRVFLRMMMVMCVHEFLYEGVHL
jgi:hypothetical protein